MVREPDWERAWLYSLGTITTYSLGRTGNFKICLLSAATLAGLELRLQRHVAARGARVVPTA